MSPIERVLSSLEAHSCNAKQSGSGWSARCPAHEDRRPSLSISEGEDGRALVRCHAGCSVESVCAALGLRVVDLMSTSTEHQKNAGSNQLCRRRRDSKSEKVYHTADEAIAKLETVHGKVSAQWTYRSVEGDPVGVVLRWDRPGGKKEIRPISKHHDGWRVGGMPSPRPLYDLPGVIGADRVFIVEGEKAAEAARSLGLAATTSAHGSQSPSKTDWTPLAGKECILLPDNDQPGVQYSDSVVAILSKLSPKPVVKIVELPYLPERGDLADWVDMQPEDDRSALREKIDSLVELAEVVECETKSSEIERFRPFPTDALPEPVREFIKAGAAAIGCDQSFLALPMLAVLGAAIGNSRRIQLKRGWSAPAIIWTAIVGESGSAKTPAFKLVMKPLREKQRRALDEYQAEKSAHDEEMAVFEKSFQAWKRDSKTSASPPTKPEAPVSRRYFVSDTTVEAFAIILVENPRGILLARDELAGWLASFDRYSGGKGGADAAHWLSMHNGESLVVDRKTGSPKTLFVDSAFVSITGGIQPAVLHRALGIEHRESGLAARLLLTSPPRKPKRWSEADVDPRLEAEFAILLERLFQLESKIDVDGRSFPLILELTPDAKKVWKRFYNAHASEQAGLSGDLAAAWSKLEEYAARLALIVHLVRWAADDPTLTAEDYVDAESMQMGIELATWFKRETRRVYALLSESEEQRERRGLLEWIERKGGRVTVRQVQQGHRRFKTTHEAELALNELVELSVGNWDSVLPGAKGGRPSRYFSLHPVSTSTKPSAVAETDGFENEVEAGSQASSLEEDWGVV